jgi:hypothetical protein
MLPKAIESPFAAETPDGGAGLGAAVGSETTERLADVPTVRFVIRVSWQKYW